MISNTCLLTNPDSLQAILKETERVAVYNELDQKQTNKLMLLSEELCAMMPKLLEICDGKFWIENDGTDYEMHVSVESLTADYEQKKQILELSKSGENVAVKGILGKIVFAVENMMDFYSSYGSSIDAAMEPSFYTAGVLMETSSLYTTAWSLNAYQDSIQSDYENKQEEWDELEKSIIAKIADDVIVGVKGGMVDIVVKKSF